MLFNILIYVVLALVLGAVLLALAACLQTFFYCSQQKLLISLIVGSMDYYRVSLF